MTQTEEPDELTRPPEDSTRWRLPGPLDLGVPALLMIGVGLLLIGVAAVAALQLRDLQGDEDARQDAAETASEFIRAAYGYDYRDLDTHRNAVVELASPEFAEGFEGEFSSSLRPVYEELEAQAEAHIRDVFVGDVSGDRVVAFVWFDTTIESTVGTRRLNDAYARLDLLRVDGEWRTDELAFFGGADQALEPVGEGAEGTSPTTTAVPPPTTAAPG